MDLIVCGAGSIGLSIAWQAAKRGMSVTVLDQRGIGRGASWAGAGILPPGASREKEFQVLDPIEQLRSASHAMFPTWCEELTKITGIDVGFRKCGAWHLARSAGEWATLAATEFWWDDHGIRYERWSKSDARPPLNILKSNYHEGRLLGAWYLPDEWQVRNPHYLNALVRACEREGVALHDHEAVCQVELADNRPRGQRVNIGEVNGDLGEKSSTEIRVHTTKQTYKSAQVCFTAGAWTPFVTRDCLPVENGVVPIRGQMVLVKLQQPLFASVVNEGHRYLVPRDDGHVLIGSCEEEAGYDEEPTDSMQQELTDWAFDLAPELRIGKIVKRWAGLRPGSIDGLPFIGAIPGKPGMFVAAGHYRHGLHWSPITSALMVDLLSGVRPSLDLTPFSIARGNSYSKQTQPDP